MNLYGDLPPAQGETPQGSAAAWKPSGSTAPSSTSTAAGNKPVAKPALAFKPRQTTQPVHNLKSSASSSLPSSMVGRNGDQLSLAASQTSYSTSASQRLTPANVSVEPKVVVNSNAASSCAQEFNHNSNFDVMDAYDPRVPNEYIAYCEERLEKRRLVRVEEENRRVMAEAERARADLEQERRDASNRGDYQSLLMLSAGNQGQGGPDAHDSGLPQGGLGAGRGRGRGLVNLPAWMTQQLATAAVDAAAEPASLGGPSLDSARYQDAQPQQLSRGDPGASAQAVAIAVGVKRKQTSQFNKPSLVLLLKNMVGPEEVDDQLGPETQQECQKYGPVASCLVFALPPSLAGLRCPDEERVRTFVEFHSQESAVRAFRDMNGRFFGGRQIAASFYDEDRYRGRDLAPDATESAAWA